MPDAWDVIGAADLRAPLAAQARVPGLEGWAETMHNLANRSRASKAGHMGPDDESTADGDRVEASREESCGSQLDVPRDGERPRTPESEALPEMNNSLQPICGLGE